MYVHCCVETEVQNVYTLPIHMYTYSTCMPTRIFYPLQSEGVEESTGIVYPHQEEGERRSQREHTSLAPKLIKSSFTQIHVSYDRIEPETGESENVAVEVDGGSREGRRGAGLTPQMEEGELVSSEETEGELGTPLRDEVLAKLAAEDDKGSSVQ